MNFPEWLQNELAKRNWDQSEIVRRGNLSGYKISHTQVSRIVSGTRNAGPEACIAIAHALSIPREKVFRARGWLLKEPKELVPIGASPKAARVIRLLAKLPLGEQEAASEAFEAQLRAMDRVNELRALERPSAPVRRSLDEIQAELEEEFRTLLPDAYERVLKRLAAEEAAALASQAAVAA